MILPENLWESIRPYFLARAREMVEETWAEVAGEIDARLKNELREALYGVFQSSLAQALEEKLSAGTTGSGGSAPDPAGEKQGEVPKDILFYLYCVTDGQAGETLKGILPGHDTALNLVFSQEGRFCAVVGECSANEFSEEVFEEKLGDLGWLEEKARLHQEVIEFVLKTVEHPVIPMKFGSVFSAPEKVAEMLSEQGAVLKRSLDYLRGRQEWGVKIYCRRDKLEQEIMTDNPSIKDMMARVSGGTSAGMAFMMKKKLESSIQGEIEKEMDRICTDCHRRLSELACAARVNKLLDKEITGEEDEMIFNAAYLVENHRVEDFLSAAGEMREGANSSLSFAVTGPWPAYNFSGEAGSDEAE